MRASGEANHRMRNINRSLRKDSKAKLYSPHLSRISTTTLSQLTINSLILLGFDTDEYLELYSGIAFDLLPLAPTSFDRENEKMMSVILHYLLLILDQDAFSTAIKPCFPYLNAKEKRFFYKAIFQCIKRLQEHGQLPAEMDLRPISHPSGDGVWRLLKVLSDRSLDVMVERYNAQIIAQRHHLQHSQRMQDEISENFANEFSSIDAPTADQKDNLSIHYIEGNEEDTLEHIQTEFFNVRKLMLEMEEEHYEASDYIAGLELRLDEAMRRLRKVEIDAKDPHLLDEHHVMSEQGALKRERLIDKIESQISLLQQFLDAQLMNKVVQYLDNNEVDDDALSVSSSGSSPAGKEQRMLSSPPAFQRSLARLNSMKSRTPIPLDEMEKQQTNLRDVIDGLIHKIDEVSVYL